MGYGVPAGLGLQVATGRRPVVLVGDGAFQMTGWELGNAARCGCDPIVLVFNNASWEMLRTFAPGAQFNDLGRWDFAAMAAGMGVTGIGCTPRPGWRLRWPRRRPRADASSCWTSSSSRASFHLRCSVSSRP